jgi:molybdopterin converting factor small subunit
MVTIRFPALFSEITKEKKTKINSSNLDDLLNQLLERYGEQFKKMIFDKDRRVNRFVSIYLNGIIIPQEKYSSTKLDNDDVVAFLVIISGG